METGRTAENIAAGRLSLLTSSNPKQGRF